MGKWAWFPLIGSILGALLLVFGFVATDAPIQKVVAAVTGVALATIPYIFARTMSELNAFDSSSEKQQTQNSQKE